MGCDVKNFRGVLPKAAVLALLCASLTIFASTAFAQEGTFVPTGGLGGPRQSHTATLLNNGTVLIAGGSTGLAFPAIAEEYDPATGIFAPTRSLNGPPHR